MRHPSREHTMRFLILMLAGALVACTTTGSPASQNGVALTVTPDRGEPGDTLTLVLRNDSEDELGYNLCTSSLARRTDDDAWDSVESDHVCTMELRILSPRQRATYAFELPAGLASGTYRLETTVQRMARGTSTTVATEPFKVDT